MLVASAYCPSAGDALGFVPPTGLIQTALTEQRRLSALAAEETAQVAAAVARLTRQTLRVMRELVREWKIHPRLRQLAKKMVQACPPKNIRCEVGSIHRFVSNKIRYVRDVQGVETVQAPDVTLRDKSGDCDDQAVLVGALLCSIGHPVRFVAVGFRPGQFAHVYAETPIGIDWVAVETTMKGWPLGRKPRGVIHMVQKV